MKPSHLLVSLASLSLLSVVPIQHAAGQCPFKLTASDGAEGDSFGRSVSISGNATVVGAFFDDDAGSNSGAAYVYRLVGNTWIEEQKLTASDAADGDQFGNSVSISGNVAVVGAHFDDDLGAGTGAAYVFRFNGTSWVEEQKLTASDGTSSDQFGNSVSISGDAAVIGAFGDTGATGNTGSAYVYRFDGSAWVEEQKLSASDGAGNDQFGVSVSLIGDVAVVGAWHDGFNHTGSAYVYRFDGNTCIEEQKLTASDGITRDQFGNSVSISGDAAVIGAFGDEFGLGSAYVYRFDDGTWVEEQKLTASDSTALFGDSVSINGDVAVVGAPLGRAQQYNGQLFRRGDNV